ncbi:MAG: hypothetical protein ACLUE1_01140 [Adlercreutzia equolifaciens]
MAMVFALLVVSMLVLNDRLIGDALRRKSDSAAMPRRYRQGAGSAERRSPTGSAGEAGAR